MGVGNKNYPIDDSTAATPFLAAGRRNEVILRTQATNDIVFLAFNEPAEVDAGIFLKAEDTVILNGEKASAAIHGVCATGESAVICAQITL